MEEAICPHCRSKSLLYVIPDIDKYPKPYIGEDPKPLIPAEYCHACGKDLSRQTVYLKCCKIQVLDVDYCKFCPRCGKRSKLLLPEVKEEIRKREEQRLEEEQKEEKRRTQSVLYPQYLQRVIVEKRFTHCEYQGNPEDMLSALHRDQKRSDLIVKDALEENKNIHNRIILLSDNMKQLEIISQCFASKNQQVELAEDRIADAKASHVRDRFGLGVTLLTTPTEFVNLELRYVNRLFFISSVRLDESLSKQIHQATYEREDPMIFDYVDQDEKGYFDSLYRERVKLYQKRGAKLQDQKNGGTSHEVK